MGLREEAAATSNRAGSQDSAIERIIASEPDHADDVIALVWDDRHIDAAAVGRTLTKHFGATYGQITDQQVRYHRRHKARP